MGKIIALSADLIPKIAAGEVIERPSSVVKELIDNSIDAGATSIRVEIVNSGFDLIRVIDDGEGMDQKDLLKCCLPFNTSKIAQIDDLEKITTMGFRGEALNSIASVSNLVIKSRDVSSNDGSQISMKFGGLENISPVGLFKGTVVEVTELFHNVPARKKFLKSTRTEYRNILNTVSAFTLGFPNIVFSFSHNGKEIFNFRNNDLHSRFNVIIGKNIATHMMYLYYKDNYLEISGFISKPQVAQSTGLDQYLYVNNRYVTDAGISKCVTSSYGNNLEAGSKPPYVLYIKCNTNLVDVNVHPRKEEIRFWDQAYVLKSLTQAVTETLAKNNLTYVKGGNDFYKGASKDLFLNLKDSSPAWKVRNEHSDNSTILQIDKTYLICINNNQIMVIDQHAAHESILFDQFYKTYKDKTLASESFYLEEPFLLNLNIKDAQLLTDNLGVFNSLGFDISCFGTNEFRISALPVLQTSHDVAKLIMEMLADISETGRLKDIDSVSRRTIAFLACRTAVKAGDYLNPEERLNLVNKLSECSDLYTCPHGRPVKVIITSRELAKMFKRIK